MMPTPKRKPVEAGDGSYAGLVLAAFDALEKGEKSMPAAAAPTAKFAVTLTEDQAWALAQMCKRFTFEHSRELSDRHATYGGATEQEHMLDAVNVLRRCLRDAGFAPR